MLVIIVRKPWMLAFLMAGFVAVSAGAIMPSVATKISQIFSQVASVMTRSAAQGS